MPFFERQRLQRTDTSTSDCSYVSLPLWVSLSFWFRAICLPVINANPPVLSPPVVKKYRIKSPVRSPPCVTPRGEGARAENDAKISTLVKGFVKLWLKTRVIFTPGVLL